MRITINTEKKYDVAVGLNILSGDKLKAAEGLCTEFKNLFNARKIKPEKVTIIWDENIDPEPVEIIGSALEHMGLECLALSVSGGESSKTLETYKKIMTHLDNFRMDKGDMIVSVGGGAVSDLAGFAASTYMKGIPCVFVPTTLLAMIDAVIGGKNALNVGNEKNILGTVYYPEMVLADPILLRKLSESQMKSGIAEMIKIAFIADRSLYAKLHQKSFADLTQRDEDLLKLIFETIEAKNYLITQDNLDHKRGLLMNFGHTYGRAIETASQFRIAHGYAVSVGMVLMTKYAVKNLGTDQAILESLKSTLKLNGLPVDSPMDNKTLQKVISNEKSVHQNKIKIVYPIKVSECDTKEVPVFSL